MISIFIAVLGAVTHLFKFGYPASVVFDEVFYGSFLSSYWQGMYFFDQHPPLFKLLMAFVGYISGASVNIADWSSIGNSLPSAIIDLRLLPILAGILLPIVIYYLCRRLDISKLASFLVATLLCLENSLIVQSRFILPDIFMLLVGFSSILFYLEYLRRQNRLHKFLFFTSSTILAASALSIKWTGLTFLFFIFVMEIFRLYELKNESGVGIFIPIKDFAKFASKYIIIAVVIYTSLFAIHFAALPNSGKGDVFMTNQFQKTLIGNPNANATNTNIIAEKFPAKFFELNEVMFATNHGMTATHSYSSKWYTWPLMQRTVFYWQDVSTSTDSRHSYIYLLGNPFIYWLSAVSVIFLVVLGAFVLLFKDLVVIDDSKKKKLLFLIVIGYLTNFLPFIFIGRVMFLYHYETALIFAVISIAFFLDLTKGKRKIAVATIIILLAFSAYLYWSPLTYGTPLSDSELAGRMWLPSWR